MVQRGTISYFFRICFVLAGLSVLANGQSLSSEDYSYPTKLEGGYRLVFKVKDDVMSLYLAKGRRTITELNSCSAGLPMKNLGYVAEDLNAKYFVFAQSFGSGNPHDIRLIEKSSGKNLLEPGAIWIDSFPNRSVLLYSPGVPRNFGDKIILFDVSNLTKRAFVLPKDIFDENEVYLRIHIANVTAKSLVINYQVNGQIRTKVYPRR